MMMTQNLNNTHKSKIRCQNCTNQLRFFLWRCGVSRGQNWTLINFKTFILFAVKGE
jgi:lipopolysaccharide biosynthesis regulator YciM